MDGYAVAHLQAVAPVRHAGIDDPRLVAFDEALQCRDVQMIVVIVRHDHDIDGRQIVEGDSRRSGASRPGEGHGACALRPDGIRQDVETRRLDQQCRMADHGHHEPLAIHALLRLRRDEVGSHHGLGPIDLASTELPAQQIGKPARFFATWIEEDLAVEMIRDRAAVIAVARLSLTHAEASKCSGDEPEARPFEKAASVHGSLICGFVNSTTRCRPQIAESGECPENRDLA